ncbi:sigma-54-dependent transcriptional regulator [Novosphingopyxis sp.]|uniref:sigma-54-dependent transcriptional regulator n=1 Tax=Novosphingopyxis sp. TaxID=2709690 RepID=UPI003B5B6EAA
MSNKSPEPIPDILIVDDDADVVRAARLLLERRGFGVRAADGPDSAWIELAKRRPEVILLDLNFARGRVSGDEGLSLLDRLIAADPHAVVVIITGHSGIAIAVKAMRAGASDFLIKPWNNDRLTATVKRAVAQARQSSDRGQTPAAALTLLGESPAIVEARTLIARIAPTMAGVLVMGPTGAGKTLAADLIHRASVLAGRSVIRLEGDMVDPARLPNLAGETVLIETIDRVPREAQHAFADVLDGARPIATTRLARDALREAVTGDLLYRFNTIEITLPPLVDRANDIVPLARHFLALSAAKHGKAVLSLSEEAAHTIAAHSWPDNFHGMQQAMERAALLATGGSYEAPDFVLPAFNDEEQPAKGGDLNLERHERRIVLAALKRHSYNISRAAEELGLTRAALYRRMDKHGI